MTMPRGLLILVVVAAALASAHVPLVVAPTRTRLLVPAALVTGEGLLPLPPARGASRDRSLPGKARRRSRRAA